MPTLIEREKRMFESERTEPVAVGPGPTSFDGAGHGDRGLRVITTRPQLAITDQELRARVQWGHRSSHHFELSYDRTSFSEKVAAGLTESLEIAYSLIFHFTHESFPDRFLVYAIDQRQTALLGRSVRSHFNFDERAIYLVESSSQHIQSDLVELVTHAMRIARYARHYRSTSGWAMLEEGFAAFLSERLSTQPQVFPFYGADVEVIANHLYHADRETLPSLWSRPYSELTTNRIVLAGAFIIYLGDTFSDDTVATLSKSDYPITTDTFRTFFGSTLEDLEAAWLQHLPISLVALTEEEQNTMVQQWDRAIECKRRAA